VIFYEIDLNIILNVGLNKNLTTNQWKRKCVVDLFCLEIIFTKKIEHLHSLFHVSSLFNTNKIR